MKEHSPAPWEIVGGRDEAYFAVWSGGKHGGEVCEITQTSGAAEADEANAALICAAPDLLAALETVVEHWAAQFERNGHLAPEWCQQARAAIAKAKGDASP